jgi:uncharacterized protein
MATRIGLISDTHGLLRPEAAAFLAGSAHIVHAGDVGDPAILDALAAIAPLTVVRGNVDTDAWAQRLPETARVTVAGVTIYTVHDVNDLGRRRVAPPGVRVVVTGHSHKPVSETRDGVLYVNPGSAGPRRFRLPITVAEMVVDGDAIDVRIVPLVGAD